VVPGLRGAIATMGVFDGVHVGHRAILDRTLNWARVEGRPAVVVTFATHPDEVVKGHAPPLLISLAHRRLELERAGMDAVLALRFDAALREVGATEFVEQVLVAGLGARGLVLGHDTAVGRDRQGDAAFLAHLGVAHGFEVKVVGEIAVDGEVVSSTRIREALADGDLERTARLLGRAPSVLGRVVEGERRGRRLGFPTANLEVSWELRPVDGVYAVLVRHDGERHGGICNIGRRPTFGAGGRTLLEVHLLEFEGDLYGHELEIVFVARLRGEQTFNGPDELKAQIARDREAAVRVLRSTQGPPPA